jgi:hypothetical protein
MMGRCQKYEELGKGHSNQKEQHVQRVIAHPLLSLTAHGLVPSMVKCSDPLEVLSTKCGDMDINLKLSFTLFPYGFVYILLNKTLTSHLPCVRTCLLMLVFSGKMQHTFYKPLINKK